MKFNKPKQKTAIVFLNIIKVLMIIGVVGMYIGGVCMTGLALAVPAVSSNIETSSGEIKVFKTTIEYEANEDNNLVITINDKEYEISSEKIGIDFATLDGSKMVKMLSDLEVRRLLLGIELFILSYIVVIVFTILETKKLINVISNTVENETPFVDSNPKLLMNAVTLLVYEFLATIVLYYVGMIASKGTFTTEINGNILIQAAVLYILAWGIEKGNAKTSVKTAKEEVETKPKKTTKKK